MGNEKDLKIKAMMAQFQKEITEKVEAQTKLEKHANNHDKDHSIQKNPTQATQATQHNFTEKLSLYQESNESTAKIRPKIRINNQNKKEEIPQEAKKEEKQGSEMNNDQEKQDFDWNRIK